MTASVTAPVEPESLSSQTYLPRLVLGREAEAMAARWVPVEGTVVIADITGFTPLSERLAAHGKEGAELLTAIINHYFQRLLDSAVLLGGDNLKFGGDALLLLFRGEQHAERAVAAALAMQSENGRVGAIHVGSERAHLQMRISVHSDTFWSAIVGEDDVRLQHIIAGPGIAKLAIVDKMGAPGEVAMSEATRAILSDGVITALRGKTIVAKSIGRRVAAGLSSASMATVEADGGAALHRWAVTPGGEGENRKVTVMFARLDGINELLDEGQQAAAFEGLNAFVKRLVHGVEQYGGYIANNDVDQSGIKFIILFGAPVAHEEAAANALRLALGLNDASSSLRGGLSLRIGLNSGFVFCGDVGASHRREYTVLGDAVNLSARLMSRAETGQVLVSDSTAAEAGPTFRWQPLPPMTIKGKSHPVPVRLLEGEGRPVASGRSQIQFVGRENERRVMADAIDKALHGRPQVLSVTGEAGSGKSRLLSEIVDPLGSRWTILRGEALSFTSGMPFAAWTRILSGILGLRETSDVADRNARATTAITLLDAALLEPAALLNPLLSLSLPESDLLRSLDADTRRERLLTLFGQLLAACARRKPTVVVIEDLHWSDQSSREVLATVAASLGDARLLLCATSREPLELPGEHTAIPLTELSAIDAEALLASVLGAASVSPAIAASIAEKCRGNPLFLEEVARALVLDGAHSLGANLVVPDRLQSLLMARLDSLPQQARRVARLAAVLGNEFDAEIVREMLASVDRPTLDLALRDLAASTIIFQDGDGSNIYRFRHSLQQEVAYESLLFARRRELHDSVTSILETRHATDLNSVVETLAYHTGLSGDAEKSARYSTLAGDKARGVYAWDSAIAYYNTALQALMRVARSNSRVRSALLERIGDCLEPAGRYGQAAETYGRALDAWTAHFRRATAGQAVTATILPVNFDEAARGLQLRLKIAVALERNSQYDRSLRWLKAAYAAMPARRPDLRADIYSSWSVALFRKGKFLDAVELARKALADARKTGQPPKIAYAHLALANPYARLGRLRNSVRHREASLGIYEQLGDLPRMMAGHGNLGLSYQSLGDLRNAITHHQACIQAAEQLGNAVAAAIGYLNLGEVLLQQGHVAEATDRFRATIATYRATGEARVPAGLAMVNLSRAYLKSGQTDLAAQVLAEGMDILRLASPGLAAEGVLQEAEIALARDDLHQAREVCNQALHDARTLGMPLLELKAELLIARMEQRECLPSAVTTARRALSLARRIGASYETATAAALLSRLHGPDGPRPNPDRSSKFAIVASQLLTNLGVESA